MVLFWLFFTLALATSNYNGTAYTVTAVGSHSVYTAKGYYFADNFLKHDLNATFDECISNCLQNPVQPYGGCYTLDRPLNTVAIVENALVTVGFVLSRSPNCVDSSGSITCKTIPDSSGKSVKGNNETAIAGVALTNKDGWFAADCEYSLLPITNNYILSVSNGNAASNETVCQSLCLNNHFQCTAYIYHPPEFSCLIFDKTIDSLEIRPSSMWKCGFLLSRSTNCFDDGTKINCDSSARNLEPDNPNLNQTTNSSGGGINATWLIGGIVIAVLVVLLLTVGYLFYKYHKKQTEYNPKRGLHSSVSNSTLSGQSTPVDEHPNSPLNNDYNRYSHLSQETQYQRFSQVPSENPDSNRDSIILDAQDPITADIVKKYQTSSANYGPKPSQDRFSYSQVFADTAYPSKGTTFNYQVQNSIGQTPQYPPQTPTLAQLPIIAQVPELDRLHTHQPPKLFPSSQRNTRYSTMSTVTSDIQPPKLTTWEEIRDNGRYSTTSSKRD
ncbi:hypothetical protein HDV04_000002 [Boothiomyces sp. JEL0838]|nr:hypothetical protein HDV04_000002 [Boothiomyces sp. JEL0838]